MKNSLLILFTFLTFASFGQNESNQVERNGFVIGFGLGAGVITQGIKRGSIPLCKAGGLTAHGLPVSISLTCASSE